MINFEEFQKIDLKIGKVLEAEKVENSEKLLRLKVDLGEEQRQIIAGIGKVYQPQDLINQEIVVVVNLEPKTLMGFKSQGMLLAADNNGEPILIKPEKEVLPGTKIH